MISRRISPGREVVSLTRKLRVRWGWRKEMRVRCFSFLASLALCGGIEYREYRTVGS